MRETLIALCETQKWAGWQDQALMTAMEQGSIIAASMIIGGLLAGKVLNREHRKSSPPSDGRGQ